MQRKAVIYFLAIFLYALIQAQIVLARQDLELSGIVYDEHKGSSAIVNGILVQQGDVVGGVKVLEIKSDKVIFMQGNKTFTLELGQLVAGEATVIPLSRLELGATSLNSILVILKTKNIIYQIKNGDLHFTIMHKYKDYLDAPYTIVLTYKDVLFGNEATYELFFTPKSKVLYRVEISTNGEKDNFLKFYTKKYNKQPIYSDACYYWPSKPDPATNEIFYNVLFCPNGAYSPTITLSWTDWDYLYGLAVMEGVELRSDQLKE